MTRWQALKARLADPIVLGGLLLLILGEVQAQSDILLSWLSPEAAGRVLSLIGIIAMVIRYLQTIPVKAEEPDDVNNQSGFAKIALLFQIASWGVLAAIVIAVQGCSWTKMAYQEAESLDEYAYVLAEHYASLVKEAADLKERPGTPQSVIRAMQEADQAAKPVITELRELRDVYMGVRNAQTEADLQAAIDRAVLKIADLVRAVQSARKSGSTSSLEDRILDRARFIKWSYV